MRVRQIALIAAGVVAGFVALAVVLVTVGVLPGHVWRAAASGPAGAVTPAARSGSPSGAAASVGASSAHVIRTPVLTQEHLARLPEATTLVTVSSAPVDLSTPSNGNVIRVSHATVAFAEPGGDPIARIPASQIGSPTWLPVIDARDGWARVRLPSRPNGATAWIPVAGLQRAQTDWAVRIALSSGRMTVTRHGRVVGDWPIAQGRASTPTPVGQTFLLAGFVDAGQSFSPVIYALGMHSETLDTFGGGPGTVAVHGWPTAAGRSGRVSHGCVRVPPDALEMFARLPAGTPVDINS